MKFIIKRFNPRLMTMAFSAIGLSVTGFTGKHYRSVKVQGRRAVIA